MSPRESFCSLYIKYHHVVLGKVIMLHLALKSRILSKNLWWFIERGTYTSVRISVSTFAEKQFPFMIAYILSEVVISYVCIYIYIYIYIHTKKWQVAVLSVETAARSGNCLFQRFFPVSTFETTQNCLRVTVTLCYHLWKKIGCVFMTKIFLWTSLAENFSSRSKHINILSSTVPIIHVLRSCFF
jgi:hypothetical protein